MMKMFKILILIGTFAFALVSKADDQCLESIQDSEDPTRDLDLAILREPSHPLDTAQSGASVRRTTSPSTGSSSNSHTDTIYQIMNASAKQKGEAILGRILTEKQAQALVNISQVKGFLSKELLYLEESLQTEILKQAKFSQDEIDQLLFEGVDSFLLDRSAPARVLLQSIVEGRALPGASPYVLIPDKGFGRIVNYEGPGKITIEIPHFITNERHLRRQQVEIKAIRGGGGSRHQMKSLI